jgi:hypothetical protein
MFSRSVFLGTKDPSGAYDKIFTIVRRFRVCWCGALSLTGGRVCRLQLLLVLVSAVIFGSESLGIRDHILLPQIQDWSLEVKVKVTLRHAVYGQSVRLGARPLLTHDQRFFLTELLR